MSKKKRTRGNIGGRPLSDWLLWSGVGALAAIVVLIGFFAFAGRDDGPSSRERQDPVVSSSSEVSVDVIDNDYEPRDLTVRPGARVTWTFDGDLPHSVTDAEGSFDSGILGKGAEFTRTFDEPAEYSYYCTLHHAMVGTLVVAP